MIVIETNSQLITIWSGNGLAPGAKTLPELMSTKIATDIWRE